jgi:hypothetical protein
LKKKINTAYFSIMTNFTKLEIRRKNGKSNRN